MAASIVQAPGAIGDLITVLRGESWKKVKIWSNGCGKLFLLCLQLKDMENLHLITGDKEGLLQISPVTQRKLKLKTKKQTKKPQNYQTKNSMWNYFMSDSLKWRRPSCKAQYVTNQSIHVSRFLTIWQWELQQLICFHKINQQCSSSTNPWQIRWCLHPALLRSHRMTDQTAGGVLFKRRFVAIPLFQIPSTHWGLPALVHLLACSHSHWKPEHSYLTRETWCRKLWKQNWTEKFK